MYERDVIVSTPSAPVQILDKKKGGETKYDSLPTSTPGEVLPFRRKSRTVIRNGEYILTVPSFAFAGGGIISFSFPLILLVLALIYICISLIEGDYCHFGYYTSGFICLCILNILFIREYGMYEVFKISVGGYTLITDLMIYAIDRYNGKGMTVQRTEVIREIGDLVCVRIGNSKRFDNNKKQYKVLEIVGKKQIHQFGLSLSLEEKIWLAQNINDFIV